MKHNEADGSSSWTAMVMHAINALLKQPDQLVARLTGDEGARQGVVLGLIAIGCLFVYGLLVGAFSGGMQWIAAPVKLLLGTALTALLCFPSLYIFSALGGADLRPSQLLALLSGALALSGLLLLGFAPVAFVFTFSVQSLPFMGGIHLAIGLVAVWFGFRFLERGIRAPGNQATQMLQLWAAVFLVTWLQMATTLRPILGATETLLATEKLFFLNHWLETVRSAAQIIH